MAKNHQTASGRQDSPSRKSRARRRLARSWRWINLGVLFVLLVLLAGPTPQEHLFDYIPGAPLSQPLRGPFDLRTPNRAALAARIEKVERTHFFRIDLEARQRSLDDLDRILALAGAASLEAKTAGEEDERKSFGALVKALASLVSLEEGKMEQDAEILARRADWEKFAPDVRRLLIHLYDERGVIEPGNRVKYLTAASDESGELIHWDKKSKAPDVKYEGEKLLAYPEGLAAHLSETLLPQQFREDAATRETLGRLLTAVAEPIIVYDTAERQSQLKTARSPTEMDAYSKGDELFAAGTTIGEEEEALLDQFRARGRRYQALSVLGVSIFVAILLALVVLYARKFPGETRFTASFVLLAGTPTLIVFGLWRFVQAFTTTDRFGGFAFPAALIGMLGTALLGPRLSWLLVTCASLLYGVAPDFQFECVLLSLFAGYTAITSLYSTQTRRDILVSGALVGAVNAIVYLAIRFITDPEGLYVATQSLAFTATRFIGAPGGLDATPFLTAGWGLANGLLCGALALPLLWLFERAFGVVTDFTLLELTGTRHPLLRELEEKAPGTFQHVLNVTKLAESAATAIGANYLLVRAGGYFHDVGKMFQPRYFGENQITQEDRNLHAKCTPVMSARIIKNHVRKGLEEAQKHKGRHKIPPVVLAFIPEHHGTSLISYFHDKALKEFEESESTVPVQEDEFRHSGPKPQSIETAIIMLADSVEATATSVFTSSNVNEDELRRVVRRSIAEKFDDGQFDECDLTLRDLHIISETFVKTLLGRFHHRVAYPVGPRNGGSTSSAAGGIRRVAEVASSG
jgi:putative nucleotidyltransferase with HDIG domain